MTEPNSKKNPSVIYSFEGRWEEPLRRGEVHVFFRKRRPIKFPSHVFMYVGVPVKAVIGFAKVDSINEVSFDEANASRKDGAITENELIKYFGEKGRIHAIRIGRVVIFKKFIALDELNRDFEFNPPQSFSIMSPHFEDVLSGKAE